MNKYAIPVLIAFLATSLTFISSISAEEASDASSPFSVSTAESDNAKKTLSSEAAETDSEDSKENEEESQDGFPVDGVVKASRLRLRQWPWGPVLDMYNSGAKVSVTGVSGEFYAVSVNGVKGYMHKNYVSIPGNTASMVAPYYPGNTASGGYLPKSEGKAQSKAAASGKSKAASATKYTFSGTDTGALASYQGGKLPPDKFIALFGPVARDSMKTTGVPASVTLAQAILETGWGKSSIGDAKNLFGIKGTGPAGSTKVYTQECYGGNFVTIKDGFRKYHNWQQSIDDHAALLQNSRYSGALANFKSNGNANQYAKGIHQAGYATDPGYSSKLIGLMQNYNLYAWDA